MNPTPRDDHLKRGSKVAPYEALIAGTVSGGVARGITAPLDTIKIRLQLQSKFFKHGRPVYSLVKDLLQHEGVIALWKGNVPAEMLYIIYGGVQFTSYSMLNANLSLLEKNLNIVKLSSSTHSLIAGVGAGVASTLATYPFDLLRTRLVANTKKDLLGMTATARGIIKADGPGGLFVGMAPAMLAIAPTTGLMFWSYELAREFSTNFGHVPFLEGICGFVAGTFSKGITFPLDTLRKRCQIYPIVHGKRYTRASHVFFNIIEKEGILGLYRGYGISILKTAPTSAISLWTFEIVITSMRKYQNAKPLTK
ncbi:TPC1 [Candida oxycetoniae]|uniref:Mitochondrial thiamine pyrophosphate carrier 1 n=1 Tax=Candida oxycetoniae TaxID=497107 RepID=A0AAI9T083_9ASCO|nr:TPC1 [Candida oxycetoniae]KAI3406267.2 TPC1 [Candida oxycetoniae]